MTHRTLLSLGGAAATLLAAPAPGHACHDEIHPTGYRESSSIGAFLGVTFGERTRFMYGLDYRVSSGQLAGIVRLQLSGLSTARLVVAGHAVTSADVGAELGLALVSGERRGPRRMSLGFHVAGGLFADGTGLQAHGHLPFLGDARTWEVGASLVLVPGETSLACGSGRVLREGEGGLLPALLDADPRSCAEPWARAARAAWLDDARAEYASVWAFERLAAELAAVGAPSTLVRAAHLAADDELRHTRACAALAGGAFSLAPLAPRHAAPRWRAPSATALATLAAEAWHDGCLGEGLAAAEASAAIAAARPPVAAALATIAADESRHAELSWAVLSWLWTSGPSARAAVRAALASSPSSPPSRPVASAADLIDAASASSLDETRLAHAGRLSAHARRRVADLCAERAHARARHHFA